MSATTFGHLCYYSRFLFFFKHSLYPVRNVANLAALCQLAPSVHRSKNTFRIIHSLNRPNLTLQLPGSFLRSISWSQMWPTFSTWTTTQLCTPSKIKINHLDDGSYRPKKIIRRITCIWRRHCMLEGLWAAVSVCAYLCRFNDAKYEIIIETHSIISWTWNNNPSPHTLHTFILILYAWSWKTKWNAS